MQTGIGRNESSTSVRHVYIRIVRGHRCEMFVGVIRCDCTLEVQSLQIWVTLMYWIHFNVKIGTKRTQLTC